MSTKASPAVLNLPFLMPESFGAVGQFGSDASTAIDLFLADMVSTSKTGMAMGNYQLNSHVTQPISGTVPGEHLALLGGGQNKQGVGVNNSTGGITFQGTGVARQHSVEVQDLHFEPMLDDSGFPFKITSTAGGVSFQSTAVIKGVTIGPIDETGSEGFSEGLSLIGAHRPQVENLRMWQGNASLHKWDVCLDISDCYFPNLNNVWINVTGSLTDGTDTTGGADIGIKSDGTNEEAFSAYDVTVNGADIGVQWDRDSREPQWSWIEGHINATTYGMVLNGIKFGTIYAPTMYIDKVRTGVTENVDFKLEDVDGLTIAYPKFRFGTALSRRHFHLEPKSGKAGAVVRNVTIRLENSALFASTTIPPIYCNGATRVLIIIPDDTNTDDLVSYPANLIEMGGNQNPREITVQTSSGRTLYADDASAGPSHILDRVSASPSGADRIGETIYRGRNNAGQKVDYTSINGRILDPTDGAETGYADIITIIDGVEVTVGRFLRSAANGGTALVVGVKNGTAYDLLQVTAGADDSGGSGRRMLTVPNA